MIILTQWAVFIAGLMGQSPFLCQTKQNERITFCSLGWNDFIYFFIIYVNNTFTYVFGRWLWSESSSIVAGDGIFGKSSIVAGDGIFGKFIIVAGDGIFGKYCTVLYEILFFY